MSAPITEVQVRKLITDRAALLAALEEILVIIYNNGGPNDWMRIAMQTRDAIAKVKGEQP